MVFTPIVVVRGGVFEEIVSILRDLRDIATEHWREGQQEARWLRWYATSQLPELQQQ
jgi:hypothetical protein